MGKLGVDPRGWRGVIDRPGREDFKVSETSQAPCAAAMHRERDGGTEGREKLRENAGTRAQL